MFNGLRKEILALNSDVKNVANCEKAKKLKTKLLKIGIPLAVIGLIGVFTCFALFVINSMNNVADMSMNMAGTLVPFLLFMPFAITFCIGAFISSLGLKIVVTGYAANLVDQAVGNNCPSCNTPIESDADFCPNCGTKLNNVCEKCNTKNSLKDGFCKKCGNKLN